MRNGPTQFNPNESNKVIKESQLENIPKDNPLSTASSAEQNNSGGEVGGEDNSRKSEAADIQSPLSPPSSSSSGSYFGSDPRYTRQNPAEGAVSSPSSSAFSDDVPMSSASSSSSNLSSSSSSSSPDVPRSAPSGDSDPKRHRSAENAVAGELSCSETEELTPYNSGSETEELTPPRSPSSNPINISVLRLQPENERDNSQ